MSELRSLMIHALQQGILPLTSECNTACLFCSHRYNPSSVRTHTFPSRPLAEIIEDLSLIRKPQSITIGESITTLNEGEPLCHPDLLAVLREIRRRFPETLIKLTTNGILLTRETLAEIKDLGNMELTLSLNSISHDSRHRLGLDSAPHLTSLLEEIAEYVPWHGSMVAMPHIVGEEDVASTMERLSASGAKTIRVLLPGFTRLAPAELIPSEVHISAVRRLAEKIQSQYATPMVVEPDILADFTPAIHGVVKGSPAYLAGLRGGETISSVKDTKVRTRVHAFSLIEAEANPVVKVRAGVRESVVTILKGAGQKSGLVMQYDMSPMEIDDLLASVEEAVMLRKKVMVLASPLGYRLVTRALETVPEARVYKVASQFFGGNIGAAGLLTVQDFREVLQTESRLNGALVLLPHRAFDWKGRDLCGESYMTLESFGCRVLLI